jgi:hypothetical protein
MQRSKASMQCNNKCKHITFGTFVLLIWQSWGRSASLCWRNDDR